MKGIVIKIFIPCICMFMTVCVAQVGIQEKRSLRIGGANAVLKRTQVRVGDKFEVSWPLLNENNKAYGWRWTNKDALKNIVILEHDSIADGKHTFTFKALSLPNIDAQNPGDLRIEFMNERPGQAQMTSWEGVRASYVNIVK